MELLEHPGAEEQCGRMQSVPYRGPELAGRLVGLSN
jgi:hypothetical protein